MYLEEITKHKGPPVFTEQERYKMVRAIKWVDQVVENAPYVTTLETLEEYNCAFCVHGDDITVKKRKKIIFIFLNKINLRLLLMVLIHIISLKQLVDIVNVNEHKVYQQLILLEGCFLFCNNSILFLLFRMLLVTKSHHEPDDRLPDPENTRRMSLCKESVSPWTGASQFLATTNKIIQFSNGREPNVDKI